MRTKKRHFREPVLAVVVLAIIFFCSPPSRTQAAGNFNPNNLLSDYDLTNGTALSHAGVQAFLKAKGSALSSLMFAGINGVMKSAADIIFDAGNYYKISQKYLLVRLQIEQSLITDSTPSERQLSWATGFAVCDSCSTSDSAIQKYRGFFSQVNWAAKRIRESYLTDLNTRGFTISGWGPGITKTVVDLRGSRTTSVTPANKATAAMYTYTPHVYNGNFNLWRFWDSWFSRHFPDGALVKSTDSDVYYLIAAGRRRPFRSATVLNSNYDVRKALPATPSDLAAFDLGDEIAFANYSIIRAPQSPVYLIVDGAKRKIISPEVFRTLGFNPEEIQLVTPVDVNLYPDGPVITIANAYPTGALLQSSKTGGVTYVEDGIRHDIYSKEILKSRFSGKKFSKVSPEELAQYAAGNPVKFQDGELVTAPGDHSVYFISNGQKRPIASKEVFDGLGLKWANLITTTQSALDIHPTGDPITAS